MKFNQFELLIQFFFNVFNMAPLHILIESENVELIKILLLFKNTDVNLEMISLAIL